VGRFRRFFLDYLTANSREGQIVCLRRRNMSVSSMQHEACAYLPSLQTKVRAICYIGKPTAPNMKKFSTLILALLLASASYAQIWMVGVRGGVNVSSISGEQSERFSIKPGFNAGFFSEYRLGERGGVFVDLLYSQKGANYDQDQGVGLRDARLRLDYIDIPLAFVIYPLQSFGLYVGPQISILAYSRLKTGDSSERYDKVASSTDYGIVGGFRLRPTERVAFDLRYNYNFSDMSEFDIGLNNTSIKDKNHVASLLVSYALFMRQQ
jgi:hypothetical protein